MALIFSIIIGIGIALSLIVASIDFIINFIKKRKDKSFADSEFKRTFEDNSLQGADNYSKIKRKLENELLIAESLGNWKEGQRINLNLCWLNTIRKVERNDEFSQTSFTNQESLLTNSIRGTQYFENQRNADFLSPFGVTEVKHLHFSAIFKNFS